MTLREYNGVEFLSLVNEVLEWKERTHFVVRHAGTFYLHPFDRPVDLEKVDTVSVEDITPRKVVSEMYTYDWSGSGGGKLVKIEQELPPKRGKKEVATLVIEQSKCTNWADIRPQVTQILSKNSQIEFGERWDEIRVTDRVDNLRVAASLLTERVK